MIYSSCDIECDKPKLVIMCHSYPFTSPLPKNPKNHNFEKTKKIAGDIIFFHICTKNHSHMRYGSWEEEWDRQNPLSFWAIFCPFTLLTTLKIKILKKWKKTPEDIIILHKYTKNQKWDLFLNKSNSCTASWKGVQKST